MKKPRSLRPYIERVPFAVDEIPSSVVDTAAVELKLIRPPLIVRLPRLPVVANRLVEEAVVAKLFVVVAAVPVAFTKVKFWRVEELVTRRLPRVPRPVVVRVLPPSESAPVMVVAPRYALVAKRLVEEAVVEKKFVEVAFASDVVPKTVSPPFKIDVELVSVAVNDPASAFTPRSENPLMLSVLHGEVVPSPNFPPAVKTVERFEFVSYISMMFAV
jgi:hypothetical protein